MPSLDVFKAWVKSNSIYLDSRLELVQDENGISVVAREDIFEVDSAGELFVLYRHVYSQIYFISVAIIPKSSILSLSSCTVAPYAEHLHEISGPKAELALTLALHTELLRGPKSRWWGYLQIFPSIPPALPAFWGQSNHQDADSADGHQAALWACETEIWRELYSDFHETATYVCQVLTHLPFMTI
jgi:hypothetical protein